MRNAIRVLNFIGQNIYLPNQWSYKSKGYFQYLSMIVCPVPIKIYDMHQDASILQLSPTLNPNYKSKQKKKNHNITFMKFVMNNKSKEVKKQQQQTPSGASYIETCWKTLSDLYPETASSWRNKPQKKRHFRINSQIVEREQSQMTDYGFPERRAKKSKDSQWYEYCTHQIEMQNIKGCKHLCKSEPKKLREKKSEKQTQIRTINIDKVDKVEDQIKKRKNTIQYRSPRLSIKRSLEKNSRLDHFKNTPSISPWEYSEVEV